jgi:hypothetical protein
MDERLVKATKRYGWTSVLLLAFGVHVALEAALTGRLPGAALVAALALGALAGALLVAGRPLAAVRGLDRRERMLAAAGGLLAMFAAPALVAAVRMSDAPSGSVTVFWTSSGWAAVALLAAALAVAGRGRAIAALPSIAAFAAILAGGAAVVADWERPSSFSPLVRFPVQEAAMLAGGVAFVVGGLLLVRAARSGRMDGTLVVGASAATLAAAAWLAFSGIPSALSSLAELPVQVAMASVAWGAVAVAWPRVLRDPGLATGAAALAFAPVLASGLAVLEQAVGVAGPQPLVVEGVISGSLLILAGAAFAVSSPVTPPRRVPVAIRGAAPLPALIAIVGLALPTLVASVHVDRTGGAFVATWTMPGVESVAAWAALALGLLLVAALTLERSAWPALAGVAACAAWPALLDVPTHVLTASLAPGIEQYYGTEYGSILFTSVRNLPMHIAVGGAGVGLVIVAISRVRSAARSSAASNEKDS